MQSSYIPPSPIYDAKELAIHMDAGVEFATTKEHCSFDWRDVSSISYTLIKDEEGDFSLVRFKSGDVTVICESAKHLSRVWKDFISNYKP